MPGPWRVDEWFSRYGRALLLVAGVLLASWMAWETASGRLVLSGSSPRGIFVGVSGGVMASLLVIYGLFGFHVDRAAVRIDGGGISLISPRGRPRLISWQEPGARITLYESLASVEKAYLLRLSRRSAARLSGEAFNGIQEAARSRGWTVRETLESPRQARTELIPPS